MQEVRGSSPRSSTIIKGSIMSIELSRGTGAVAIVNGEIVSVYEDPAIAEYLAEHAQNVRWRATIMKMGEAGLFGEQEDGFDQAAEEKFVDANGEFAQGEHVGDPVHGNKPAIVYSGEGYIGGSVDPRTVELMEVWLTPDTGHFSGDRHHGQPGDPGYIS